MIYNSRPSRELCEFHKATINPHDSTLAKATHKALLLSRASKQANQRSHRLETPQLLPSTLRENTQTYSQIEISQYALLLTVNISFVLIALLFSFANLAAILQCHVLFSKTIGCPAFLIANEVMDGLYSCFGSLLTAQT